MVGDIFKACFIGFENLIPNLKAILVCIGLWLYPRYKHASPLVGAATNVEPPLPVGISLHVHLVNTVIRLIAHFSFSALLLQRSGQATGLDKLIEPPRVARLHVRVADGDEQLSLLVSVENETETVDEGLDVPPTMVVGEAAVEDAAFSLGQVPVYVLAEQAQLGSVRLVLSNGRHEKRAWLDNFNLH